MLRYSIIIILCLFVVLFARERIRPEYDFKDSCFSLVYKIDIPANLPEKDVLAILFNYNLVKDYSAKTNVKISLIEENENTNKILYEYNYQVAKLGVEMFRERFVDDKKVEFQMQKYNRTAKIIPDVLSAGGSYQIIDGGKTLLYKQQTSMNKKINGIYTFFIKRDVQAYLKEIMNYLDEYANKKNLAVSN